MNLDGKVAVVTGSGRGIGRAYAHGARAGRLRGRGQRRRRRRRRGDGGRDQPRRWESRRGGVRGRHRRGRRSARRGAVHAFGRLDVMCTNAGILRDRVLWNMSDEDFDLVIETHLRGTFTCARAAVRRCASRATGGRIVVVSSIAGQRGNFGQTNYAAAKAGIAAYARTWAMECAQAATSPSTRSCPTRSPA